MLLCFSVYWLVTLSLSLSSLNMLVLTIVGILKTIKYWYHLNNTHVKICWKISIASLKISLYFNLFTFYSFGYSLERCGDERYKVLNLFWYLGFLQWYYWDTSSWVYAPPLKWLFHSEQWILHSFTQEIERVISRDKEAQIYSGSNLVGFSTELTDHHAHLCPIRFWLRCISVFHISNKLA